jgi:hypothetical protein
MKARDGKPWKELTMISVRLLATGYVVFLDGHTLYANPDVKSIQHYREVLNDTFYRFSY